MNQNDILITYGHDPKRMAMEVCKAANLESLIGEKDRSIGLKPNLVLADKAENGATTHPEIAEGVILYLQSKGYDDISVIEGSWLGDKTSLAFEACGYNGLAKKYGVKNIDTQKDTYTKYDCKGMPINICDSAMQVDFMINLPVLKGHCQTRLTCALKNNKGVIPNTEKRHFHTLGLHKPIAHLNAVAKNDFIIVDGICGDLTFEEGGNPIPMNRLIGAVDPVLCDAYVCGLIGYDIDDVPYIKMAEKIGVGSADTENSNVIVLSEEKENKIKVRSTNLVRTLARHTDSKAACSACYGSLIHALERMREKGSLKNLNETICIGQGFKGKHGKVGVGNCTEGFEKCLKGCPPKAIDVIRFLKNI